MSVDVSYDKVGGPLCRQIFIRNMHRDTGEAVRVKDYIGLVAFNSRSFLQICGILHGTSIVYIHIAVIFVTKKLIKNLAIFGAFHLMFLLSNNYCVL